MADALRKVPLALYFSAALAFVDRALTVLGIHSILLGYIFLGLAAVLAIVGIIQAILRILSWHRNLTARIGQLKREAENSRKYAEEATQKLHEAEEARERIQKEYDSIRGAKHWGTISAREIPAGVPVTENTDTEFPSQEDTIELGDAAPLFLFEGSRFVPEDDEERRTIILPDLIAQWAGALRAAVEAGRTFVARGTEFENCDIYGPGVFVLAEGSVEDTFHKCDWEEEWQAFWSATKPSRYIGAIALKNCKFRRCNFKNVSFVIKRDDYKRVYRRFTGDEPIGL